MSTVMTRGAPLAAARFGLASSNPAAPEDVLLRNALLQGRFDAILEAALHDGLPFVWQQIGELRRSGSLSEAQNAKLERMVRSIERGFAEAEAER